MRRYNQTIAPVPDFETETLYFFRFVKDQYSFSLIRSEDRRLENIVLACVAPDSSCMVEVNGIEPMTSCLQSRRSPN
jgi:hypothetical protein